jgi:beta-1,4-mannosyltransferase
MSRGGQLRVLMMPDWASMNPYQKRLTRALREQGVWVRRASPRRGPAPILRPWFRAGRPKVLHLHWTHGFLGSSPTGPSLLRRKRFLGELAVLRALGVRIVWTLHNLGSHEGARSATEMAVHRDLVFRSSGVIAHCEAAVDAALEAYQLGEADRRRFRVIPHGNYLGSYKDTVDRMQARDELGLEPDARVFLFVGTIRSYKGVDDLIAAFRALPDPSSRLVVAGKPRDDAAVQLQKEAAADPRIKVMAKRVPNAQLGGLLNAADVVVLPFRDALTSGSVILAMGFGRAIIAPRLGCLPETIPPEGSLLYDASDPAGLSAALSEALSRDLDAMGAHNREAAARLDWGPIARQTIEVYRGKPAA